MAQKNGGGRASKLEIEGLPDIDDSWTIPKDHLTLKHEIGKGAFGTVYKADYLGIDVAVKTISQGGPNADPMEKTFAEREIAVLKSCRHPNVVAFIGVVENDKGEGLQIVLEYLSKGDLGHYLLDNPEPISWIRKVKIALDVACGMAYLHARNIIFRDLKSENLLLDDTGKTKICDFGFARKSNKRAHMTMCGTDEFMAPEIIMGLEYDAKADVFSYGMLLFEIITRKDVGQVIPRALENGYMIDEENLRQKITRSTDCPSHFLELGCLCIKYAPDKRPNFLQIIGFLKKLLKRLIDMKQVEKPAGTRKT
jgi:serine/threonine protein kinase